MKSTHYYTLEHCAEIFIEKGIDISLIELREACGAEQLTWDDDWKTTLDVLADIFSFVWADIVRECDHHLTLDDDPRDAMAGAFSSIFHVFTSTYPTLGKCIILECHRYEMRKIRRCFGVPEVVKFLTSVKSYLLKHSNSGGMLPINVDALQEILMSMIDGMMFIRLVQNDIRYPTAFAEEDFAAVTRLLVSSLIVPSTDGSKSYYDAVSDQYDSLYIDSISLAENEIVGELLAQFVEPENSVLDLGCGSGLGYELLQRQLQGRFQYSGVDISPGMIRSAKNKFLFTSNAQFMVMDLKNLSFFREGSFDRVISLFGSFSHALDQKNAISEVSRVLKPGGRFLIMTYSRWSLRNWVKTFSRFNAKYLSEMRPYEIRQTSGSIFADARFYSSGSAKAVFGTAGFERVQSKGMNACLELPLVGSLIRGMKSFRLAKSLLLAESNLLSSIGATNLAHSLIVTGSKPV